MKSLLTTILLAINFGLSLGTQAQDMALNDILVEGKGWELVAQGYQFTDGLCSDAEGNLYFTDVAKGGAIFQVDKEGKLNSLAPNVPKISGMKFGPEGRIFAATQGAQKQIVTLTLDGKITVLASNVEPNDLVVSRQGFVYFTETGKGRIQMISPTGELRVADTGPYKPNGITLSVDQGTLVCTDFEGSHVFAFRIEADGTLSSRAPYMTAVTPLGKIQSMGDGMTTDMAGRFYAASAVGIQVFDPTGRLCGVIAKPEPKFISNVTFAGLKHSFLYVSCSDKIYRREMKAQGALFFAPAK